MFLGSEFFGDEKLIRVFLEQKQRFYGDTRQCLYKVVEQNKMGFE